MSEVLNTDLLNNFNKILKVTNDIFLKTNTTIDKFQVKLLNLTESSKKLEKSANTLEKSFNKLAGTVGKSSKEGNTKGEKGKTNTNDAFSKANSTIDKFQTKLLSLIEIIKKIEKSANSLNKLDNKGKSDKNTKEGKKDKEDKGDKSSKKDKKEEGFLAGHLDKFLKKHKELDNAINKSRKYVSDVAKGMGQYGQVLNGVVDIAGQLGANQDIMNGLSIATEQYNAVASIASQGMELWTSIQEVFNLVMNANPIGLIVMGIMALIAVITWVSQNTSGWGEAWGHVMEAARLSIEFFVESAKLYITTLVSGFMIAFDTIKLGYYKFKEAMGIGDSGENQKAIAEINKDVEARKKAVVDGAKKVADIGGKIKTELTAAVNSVHLNKERPKKTAPDTALVKENADRYNEFGETGAVTKKVKEKEAKPKVDTTKVCVCPEDKKPAKPPVTNNYITITINELMGIKANVINECKDSAKKAGTHVADELLKVLVKAKTATV